ncbi:AlpA family transcriptional regulator [Massilia agilis]|uniref:AlpA family transcriptional regulator n=1 Tax=Massilia agilis TaxID=1811226 RepID=A0ABT2D9P8_9BURK|nr:AlpA family transcriptional regulator [Massilia agilis]
MFCAASCSPLRFCSSDPNKHKLSDRHLCSIGLGGAVDRRHIRSGKDIRASSVSDCRGLGRSKIYQAIKAGAFPAPVKLLGRSSVSVPTENDAWVKSVGQARDGKRWDLTTS